MIRSFSRAKWFFTLSLTKKERFAQNTQEENHNLDSDALKDPAQLCLILSNGDCEPGLIALNKRAIGAIHSFSRANRFFTLSLTKNEQFAQNTKEGNHNPDSDAL